MNLTINDLTIQEAIGFPDRGTEAQQRDYLEEVASKRQSRILKATCKHCQRGITYRQGDNGMWFEPTVEVQLGAQYCWMDPAAGSKLHEPNPDTITE